MGLNPSTSLHDVRWGDPYGDDFVWEGRDEDLDWILQVLSKEYELKNRGRLGDERRYQVDRRPAAPATLGGPLRDEC